MNVNDLRNIAGITWAKSGWVCSKSNAETPRSAAKRGFICKAVKPEDRKNKPQTSFPRQVAPGSHRIMNNTAWQLEVWGAWRLSGKVR